MDDPLKTLQELTVDPASSGSASMPSAGPSAKERVEEKRDGHGTRRGSPRAQQASLFGTEPDKSRVQDLAAPPLSADPAWADGATAAMMDAYERGVWPIVTPPSAPAPPHREAPETIGVAGRAPTPPPSPPHGSSPHQPTGQRSRRQGRSPDANGTVTARARPATGHSPSLTEGHRARLRDRFNRGEQLADYELLELLLFRAVPRRDTKPIAKALIQRFGSFAAAVGATPERLGEVDGVGPAVVTDFRLVRAAAERFAYADLAERPIMTSTDAVVRFFRTQLRTATREEFHALFVDRKNRLLASECLGVGTVDQAPVYPRELIKRALDLAATAIVLVHNHPSGDPTPSRADVAMTHTIMEAANALSIAIHDHLIVAGDGYTSLRAEGLM